MNVLVCFNTSQSPIHEMDNGRRLDDGIHTWVRFGWVRSQNFVLRWVVAKKNTVYRLYTIAYTRVITILAVVRYKLSTGEWRLCINN